MIVADSSSIISLAVNCLSPVLRKLDADFVVTPRVYEEIIVRPAGSTRFALEAMRIKTLVDSGAIKLVQVRQNTGHELLKVANRVYKIRGRELKIIHPAEAEAMAYACGCRADALLIDERITRLLIEDPVSLRDLLSHRNKADVKMNEGKLKRFQAIVSDMPIIRSSEVVAVAYEKGILTRMHGVEDKKVLDAALTALKSSGCAISWDEISEYQKAVI